MKYFKLATVQLFLLLNLNEASVFAKTPPDGVTPVQNFDSQRYLGLWYELARTDNRFEAGLESVTAEYRLRDDGRIQVINRGYDPENNRWKTSKAVARTFGSSDLGQLKVTFFWPFSAGYYVFALDHENYQYALVSGDHHGYLWILARQPQLPDSTLHNLLQKAREAGFDTSELVWVEHAKLHPSSVEE